MMLARRSDHGLALGVFLALAALPDAGFGLELRGVRDGVEARGNGVLFPQRQLRFGGPAEPTHPVQLEAGGAPRHDAARLARGIPPITRRDTKLRGLDPAAVVQKPVSTMARPIPYAAVLALLLGIPLLLGLGICLFARYRESLRKITSTLTDVGHGRFDARIPTDREGFGLGEVTTKINALLDHQQNLAQSLNHASAEIAHTLKRPLIGLRQHLEHARDTALDEAQFVRLVETSISEIDSMVGMFEAILDIAQIEAGDFRARFAEVDLRSVLLKLVDVYEAVIQDRGHRLVVKLDGPGPAMIDGDSNLLFQMFNNLIENAILYCPMGTTISIDLAAHGDEVVATIADDGPGLSAEDRQNVFRPFFRPESTQQTPGHGLGIPFAAAIVRLHRARIVLDDNKPGLRASVRFSRAKPKIERKGHSMARDAISARGFTPPALRTAPAPVGLAALEHPPKARDSRYVHVEKEENSPK